MAADATAPGHWPARDGLGLRLGGPPPQRPQKLKEEEEGERPGVRTLGRRARATATATATTTATVTVTATAAQPQRQPYDFQ